MIKRIKSLTHLYWLETNLYQNLHLKQPGITYSAWRSYTKHRERIQKFTENDNLKQLYRSELEKACFAHNAAYSENKDAAEKTISE